MELLFSLITFLLGCALSWWLARQSSKELRQSNADLRSDNAAVRSDNEDLRRLIGELRNDNGELKRLVEKLPADFRSAVADDPRTTLTAQQLQVISRTVGELQDRQRPRTLTEEHSEALVAALRAIPPEPAMVTGSPGDSESMQFATQIGSAFQAAGWPTEVRTSIHADTIEGVQIVYRTGEQSEPLPMPEVVPAVINALRDADVLATAAPLTGKPQPTRFFVSVGHKPRL